MRGWRSWPRSRASRGWTSRESSPLLLGRCDDAESRPGSCGGIEQTLARRPDTDPAWVVLPRRACKKIIDAGLTHLAAIPGLQSLNLE